MMADRWSRAQPPPGLDAGEIHVWRIRLAEPPPGGLPLSPDELDRAARLRMPEKRALFRAGRTALRVLLGAYLKVRPHELEFSYGAHGKPFLPGNPLAFNFSNSGELALLAVTGTGTVGIDIEYRDRNIHIEQVAAHIFTPDELTAFHARPQSERHAALLAAWTRKEAYIKALGSGFSLPLKDFSVAVPADDAPAVLQLRATGGAPGDWTFLPLFPHPDYLAALAAPGTDWSVRRFEYASVPVTQVS